MEMKRNILHTVLNIVWRGILLGVMAAAAVYAAALIIFSLCGIRPFIVLSGSMEPAFSAGSLCFVDTKAKFENAETGDVIAYETAGGSMVTHRAVSISEGKIETKGDANEIEDAKPVYEENVIGTPIFTVPELGFLMNKIQNPPGRYVALGIAVALIFFVFITDSLTDDKKKKKGQESGSEDETEQNNQ